MTHMSGAGLENHVILLAAEVLNLRATIEDMASQLSQLVPRKAGRPSPNHRPRLVGL